MKKEYVFFLLLSLLLLIPAGVFAVEGVAIVGVWNSEHHDAKIEIFPCGSKYCGKIVWMDEPRYTEKDKEGKPGDLKLDVNNPDPSLRSKPILGMQILNGFVFDGEKSWTGTVYDPESGKTYHATISDVSSNQLHLRGYVLIPLIGRTTTWTRVQ